jgi:hypothetical protein
LIFCQACTAVEPDSLVGEVFEERLLPSDDERAGGEGALLFDHLRQRLGQLALSLCDERCRGEDRKCRGEKSKTPGHGQI